MSKKTNIQWCDSTVNPIMGCGGCELFLPPREILRRLDSELSKHGAWANGTSKKIYRPLIEEAFDEIPTPLPGHSKALSTTNLYHLSGGFLAEVALLLGREAMQAADRVLENSVTCYTAKLHLQRGRSIVRYNRGFNKGYAPIFELVTRFPGRVETTANSRDLSGAIRPDKPWLNNLPRYVFVSDMGDAFSRTLDFDFLEKEVIGAIRSAEGARHVWLWLTKRPERMAGFSEMIDGFPANVVAMTTITGSDTVSRVDALRNVRATKRGLSIEPLRDRLPPDRLDLRGIDWVIVGGESGRKDCVHPFDLAWARELRDHCHDHNVAFFVKQLGRRPIDNGKELPLRDGHGGDWSEWPEDLRVRQMPTEAGRV